MFLLKLVLITVLFVQVHNLRKIDFTNNINTFFLEKVQYKEQARIFQFRFYIKSFFI